MTECPFCHKDNVHYDRFNRTLSCWWCGTVLPEDWQECGELFHTAQPSERPYKGYDPYEDVFRDHAAKCGCITCINLKGWVDYKGGA